MERKFTARGEDYHRNERFPSCMESEQQGINAWLEEELLQEYRRDRSSVDPLWKSVFEDNGTNGSSGNGHSLALANGAAAIAPFPGVKPVEQSDLGAAEELAPLRGAAARIAENMAASAAIPLATSQRIIPVKVIDENRRLINHHRGLIGKSKVSYTHLIGWAIVRSVQANPSLNHSFALNSAGEPFRVEMRASHVRAKFAVTNGRGSPGRTGGPGRTGLGREGI